MKKAVLVNYNHDPKDWWIDYGYKPEDVLIYDRSDDGVEREFKAEVIKTENKGNVDFDKLCHLIDHYDNLPDVFLWGKTNMWKYITREEFDEVKDNQTFTPLLTKNHKTYSDHLGPVCYYSGGIYWERNPLLYSSDYKYFKDYPDFAHAFALPNEFYLPFAPGGNYILTREAVYKYGIDFYKKMAGILPYAREPLEAHFCERAYYTMFK